MRWLNIMGAAVLASCGAFGSNGNGDDDKTPTPTAPVDAGGSEAATTIPTTDDAATPNEAGSDCNTMVLLVDADNGLVDCGSVTYGTDTFVYIGLNNGTAVGIFRFLLTPTQVTTLANAGSIPGAALHLTANPECGSPCGEGLPTTPGRMEAHVARSDWDEGHSGGTYDGADRCRRTSGKTTGVGWGKSGAAPSATTAIGAPADYDTFANPVTLTDNAMEATIPIQVDADLLSRATASAISFVVAIPGGGTFIAATKESALAGATLTINYCN